MALTGMAQQVGCVPANQKVAGSIPHRVTCLGSGRVPVGGMVSRNAVRILMTSKSLSIFYNFVELNLSRIPAVLGIQVFLIVFFWTFFLFNFPLLMTKQCSHQ